MSWETSVLPTEIKGTEVSEQIISTPKVPNEFQIVTCYINVLLVPKREEWEDFAETKINEDVFRKLEESGKNIPDLPYDEDDCPR